MVRPTPEFFLLMFALFKAGAVPVLVDPGIDRRALRQCLDEAKPDAFIGIPLAMLAKTLLGWARSARVRITTGKRAWLADATLDDVAGVLQRYDQSTIDIVGHADSDGADDYNLNLSRQRASSVARYLVDRGVLADRFYVDGRGESEPVASNATESGKAQNRRVEILIRPFRG